MIRKLLFPLCFLALSVPGRCVPIVLVNNIDSPAVLSPNSADDISGLSAAFGYDAYAMPFTTGAYTSNLLGVGATITFFNVGGFGGSADSSGTNLTLSIFNDSSNNPGSFLGALTLTTPPNLGPFPGTPPEVTFPARFRHCPGGQHHLLGRGRSLRRRLLHLESV